jgi:hypothetical protein
MLRKWVIYFLDEMKGYENYCEHDPGLPGI